MVFLQSKDIFLNVANFDEETCEYKIFKKNKDSIDFLDGLYSILSGTFVALYVSNKNMFLCIAKNKYLITDDIEIEISIELNNRVFTLKKLELELEKIYYTKSSNYIENDYFTPGIDDESFDFGLFVKNILEDKLKHDRFIYNRTRKK